MKYISTIVYMISFFISSNVQADDLWISGDGEERAIQDCLRIGGEVSGSTWKHCALKKSTALATNSGIFRTYPITLRDSNVTLNCNGATFENGYVVPKIGLVIESVDSVVTENIIIKNCNFRGFEGSIHIKSGLNKSSIYTLSTTGGHGKLRELSPKNVVIDHVLSEKTNGVGIFFGSGVVGATLKNSVVRTTAMGPGIYLDFSSRMNTIENNKVYANEREGLAIDSSSFNTVQSNEFFANGSGSVFLYRNCQERIRLPENDPRYHPLSPLRVDHSSNNIIRRNVFRDEDIGVWIASRQSRNLYNWGCGNTSYFEDSENRIRLHRDYAKNNEVSGNRFINVASGTIVEDSGNKIINNFFYKNKKAVEIGSTSFLNKGGTRAIDGTKVLNNQYSQVETFLIKSQDTTNDGIINNLPKNEMVGMFINNNSEKCIDVKNRSLENGGRIQQWTCSGQSNQLFRLRYFGGSSKTYMIRNVRSNLCLNIRNRSEENGGELQQWACNYREANNHFYLSNDSEIIATHSLKCLDVKNRATISGASIQQWTCSGKDNQYFSFQSYDKEYQQTKCNGSLCY